MARSSALKNLKLLVGIGCLEFQKGMAGMDSLDKHVEQISFRQCVTFYECGQLKGWPPNFQPTAAKSSISTISCSLVSSSHMAQPRAQSRYCNWATHLGDHNSVAKPSASLREKSLLLLQRRDGHDPAITQSWWKGSREAQASGTVGTGCLVFQKGMAGMDSLDKHVEQISFRQCVTFYECGQLKGWPPNFQPTAAKSSISTISCSLVCSSHKARLRAQSRYCNTSWRPQLRDQTLCFSAWDRCFPSAASKAWAWRSHNSDHTAALRNL